MRDDNYEQGYNAGRDKGYDEGYDAACTDGAAHAEQQRAVEAALEAEREKGLRDVFAASALGAIVAQSGGYITTSEQARQARMAYQYADAMMKARR